jgi:hypothetical protein
MTNFILIFVFFIARHCIATCKMVSPRLYCIKQDCYLRLPSCLYCTFLKWSPELLYPIGVAWIGFIVVFVF